MRILFLSRWFPEPPDNGSKLRVFNLLRQLAKVHEVGLVSFIEHGRSPEAVELLRRLCVEVHTVPYRSFQPNRLTALAGFLSPQPRSVVDTYNREMAQRVQSVAERFMPDLVIASEVDMAPYARWAPGAKRLWEEIELAALYGAIGRAANSVTRYRRALTWWKQAHYVARLLRRFDGCTVVSEQEAQLLRQIAQAPIPVQVVPNGVDLAHYQGSFGPPNTGSLIYTGALTYNANLDAMQYFVADILPLILAARPDVRLQITGTTEGVAHDHLPCHPAVSYTGYLPDIRPAVSGSYLSVVPLRIGGGTRLKILESLALGTPVVTTSKGVEGLQIGHGQGVLIADTPAAFAAAVLQVLSEPGLRQTLSEAGRLAVQQYDWGLVGQTLLAFIERIAAPVQVGALANAR